jgi:hypothetical protein
LVLVFLFGDIWLSAWRCNSQLQAKKRDSYITSKRGAG